MKIKFELGDTTDRERVRHGGLGLGEWTWAGTITCVEIKGEMVTLAVPIPYKAKQINTVVGGSWNRHGVTSQQIGWDITVIWPDFTKLDEFRQRRADQSAAGLPRDEIETYSPETAGYYIGSSTIHIDRFPGEDRAVRRMLERMTEGLANALRFNKPHFLRQFIEGDAK